MDERAPNPRLSAGGAQLGPLARSLLDLYHLKHMLRRGWLRRGVDPVRCESVADHSFGVALLALLVGREHRPDLDLERVLSMALIHDAGEVESGDLTPYDGVAAAEKLARERRGAERLLGGLRSGAELLSLWEEYAAGATPEARFVRQLDRAEMALQAGILEREGHAGMEEFLRAARSGIEEPVLLALLDEMEGLRPV